MRVSWSGSSRSSAGSGRICSSSGKRRYRRAYIQMPRKNGKTFLMACVSLYEALTGEIGGEVYFVAGDRQQASRAFDECRRIVEQDAELASLFKPYCYSMEVPSTGTILRVLSSEAGLSYHRKARAGSSNIEPHHFRPRFRHEPSPSPGGVLGGSRHGQALKGAHDAREPT